jgi:hypothetical protein
MRRPLKVTPSRDFIHVTQRIRKILLFYVDKRVHCINCSSCSTYFINNNFAPQFYISLQAIVCPTSTLTHPVAHLIINCGVKQLSKATHVLAHCSHPTATHYPRLAPIDLKQAKYRNFYNTNLLAMNATKAQSQKIFEKLKTKPANKVLPTH